MEPIPALEVNEVAFDETVDVVVVGWACRACCGRGGAPGGSGRGAGRRTERRTRWDVGQLRRPLLPGRRHGPPERVRIRGLAREHDRGSFAPPRGPASTTTGSTPTARARRTTSTGWSRSACRSGRPSATSRTVSRPTTRDCSSAAVRIPTRSTRSPSPSWWGHKPRWIDSAGGFLMERLGAALSASGARVVADAGAEALVVDGRDVVGRARADRRRGPRHPRPWRGDPGRRGVHPQRGHGRRALPTGPCPRRCLADRHPERRRPRYPHGRRRRRGDDQARRLRVRAPLGPPHRLARQFLVNRHGERFINEDTYTGRIGLHALRDHDGFVYMITDDVIHEPNLLGLRVGYAAATPEELAADLGAVPPEALARRCASTTRPWPAATTRPSTSARPTCSPSACRRPAASAPSTCASTMARSTRRSPWVVSSPTATAPRSTAEVIRSWVSTPPAVPLRASRPATTPAALASATAHSSAGVPAATWSARARTEGSSTQ